MADKGDGFRNRTTTCPRDCPRPAPDRNGLDKAFWEGVKSHQLKVQRCVACTTAFQFGPGVDLPSMPQSRSRMASGVRPRAALYLGAIVEPGASGAQASRALHYRGGRASRRQQPPNGRQPARRPDAGSRVLAKIATGSLPIDGSIFLRLARSSALSVRRNGLICFSSPIVDGTVNLPAARVLTAQSCLALSAALVGSSVSANCRFFAVYSCPQ